MRFTVKENMKRCNCRSVNECYCNIFTEIETLEKCVDAFAEEMKKKLRTKYIRDGFSGWDSEEWQKESVLDRLKEHVVTGDMIDVANFAMFAWNKEI